MEKQELSEVCDKYFKCKTIQDCIDFLDVHSNYFLKVIMSEEKEINPALAEAQLINQMIFTKILHLKKSLEGVSYNSGIGKLNTIIDPTIIASLIRNLYETIAMFNLVYIQPKTDDEKLILCNLWVHAGFSYRQRFTNYANNKEDKAKFAEELKIMDGLKIKIEETILYKSLTPENQKKIQKKIKEKDYKMRFDNNNNVSYLSWQEISNYFELKKNLFEDMYTYFSLYAHPSNVSVFQFADMFGKESRDFENLTIFNLRNAFALLSIFIADYIKLFPNVLKTFESLSIEKQIVLNFYNKFMRGDDKSINEAWKALE